MSAPVIINWPESTANVDAIALAQDVDSNGYFQLVANTPNVPNTYTFDKMIRKLSFTSDQVNGGSIIITGVGSPIDADGNPSNTLISTPDIYQELLTETIPAPSDEMVESAYIYSRIDSIQKTGGDANNISVGFGSRGIVDYWFLDTDRQQYQAAYQLQVLNRTTAQVNFYQSLNKPYVTNPYGSVTIFEPIPAFRLGAADLTANTLGFTGEPVSLVWANIKNTTDDNLRITFVQQGL